MDQQFTDNRRIEGAKFEARAWLRYKDLSKLWALGGIKIT